ncbi:DUF3493 domain-containing protein [Lyngbya confervoides]|uniref:DUF3493 domain-containing protein n=1 Tax=Lyngbya confervoides BDU141951 TaxID=1574623 RepID=A0ABD4SZ88_9CYAN|nr:DUF3493 domain-containing protein [Lyngbya confervoides]MCM1981415.1 DUF3493 domain-containing protein [Lyngbya confervoides BDU141951]
MIKPSQTPKSRLSAEQLQRLQAELRSPYKPIRRFFYAGFALSGGVGAYIFAVKILAGDSSSKMLLNLLLQIGLVLSMGGLWWWERDDTPSG